MPQKIHHSALDEILKDGIPSGSPRNITISSDVPLNLQELTGRVIEHLQGEAKMGKIDQNPHERLVFARKLMEYEGDVLPICWDINEHLETARLHLAGNRTWHNVIDESLKMSAEIQKLAASLRELGELEKNLASELIDIIENPIGKE